MPGRNYRDSVFRFGFNNQEKDDEIEGEGNLNTATFREYNSRLGRRWNVDRILDAYFSSYHAFGNNQIVNVDPLGNHHYYNNRGEFVSSDNKVDEKGNDRIFVAVSETNYGLAELNSDIASNRHVAARVIGDLAHRVGIQFRWKYT